MAWSFAKPKAAELKKFEDAMDAIAEMQMYSCAVSPEMLGIKGDADLVQGLAAQMWIDMGNTPGTQINPKWRDVLEAEARLALEAAKSFAEPPKGMVAPVERDKHWEVASVSFAAAAPESDYDRGIRERDEGIARRNELMMQAVRDFS